MNRSITVGSGCITSPASTRSIAGPGAARSDTPGARRLHAFQELPRENHFSSMPASAESARRDAPRVRPILANLGLVTKGDERAWAVTSPDDRYRYLLGRTWGPDRDAGRRGTA